MDDTRKLLMALIDYMGAEVIEDRKVMCRGVEMPYEQGSPVVMVDSADIEHVEHVVDYKIVPKAGDLKDNAIIKALAQAIMDTPVS